MGEVEFARFTLDEAPNIVPCDIYRSAFACRCLIRVSSCARSQPLRLLHRRNKGL